MLSTWFASNLLIVHDKKTQAMILGNPFQEPVLHISHWQLSYFFKEIIFSFEILTILDTICKNLKLWTEKKRNSLTRPVEREWPLLANWQVYSILLKCGFYSDGGSWYNSGVFNWKKILMFMVHSRLQMKAVIVCTIVKIFSFISPISWLNLLLNKQCLFFLFFKLARNRAESFSVRLTNYSFLHLSDRWNR